MPLSLRRASRSAGQAAHEATVNKRAAIELIRRLGADEPLFWGGAVVYDEDVQAARAVAADARAIEWSVVVATWLRSTLKHIEQERPDSDFLARMTYLELKLRLPELLLMRVDKITMATSVEARVPFLDHHLVEYALGLPRRLKVEGTSGKHILKRALEEILPHDLLYGASAGLARRCASGFAAPVAKY